MPFLSTAALSWDDLTWMLIIGNGAALAALLLTLWRLRRLQRFVSVCAVAKTIKHERGWISFEEYLGYQFDIQVREGLSREDASKLKAHLDSPPAVGTSEHQSVAFIEHGDQRPTPPRSALDDFPEEHTLRTANRPVPQRRATT